MADVIIYEHAEFQGRSQVLTKGRYDDAAHELSFGNDMISSLKVPQGMVVRLYEHSHFQGCFIDIDKETSAINQFWNDRASSIIVYSKDEQPPVIKEIMIFEHADYGGNFQILRTGRYDATQISIGNEILSSALVPYGMVLRLYEHANFQGAYLDIRNDTPAVNPDWNDRASSAVVYEAAIGLWKTNNENAAIIGESSEFNGVRGISHSSVHGGVVGVNVNKGAGVFGKSDGIGIQAEGGGTGVLATGKGWHGIAGISESTTGGFGVYGHNTKGGTGVAGTSDGWIGVFGESKSLTGGSGVWGEHKGGGVGVYGHSKDGIGVLGDSQTNEGVRGCSNSSHAGVVGINYWAPSDPPGAGGNGGWFESAQGEGVRGWSKTPHHGGVVGVNTAGGVGVYGEGRLAGYFKGDVEVTGDIRLLNADCAEDFDICETVLIEPGTVMVLGEDGKLEQSQKAYDKRVAGVVSGAGNYKPGIVLDKQQSSSIRKPIALLGKVYCKVDAHYGSVEIGDLLTTSPTPGHAMKAVDPFKAFGAVIGKALRPLTEGQGLIPILIALQ